VLIHPEIAESQEMSDGNVKAQHMMVELKARVNDLASFRSRLNHLRAEAIGVFHQIDTYYVVPEGRLKLREIVGEADAELIYYEREDIPAPKRSSVFILRIPQPHAFKRIIAKVLKVRVIVDKVREVFRYEGVQIHLDKVKSLGYFIEFERITSANSEQQKDDISKIERLISQLNIAPRDLVELSYSDLT